MTPDQQRQVTERAKAATAAALNGGLTGRPTPRTTDTGQEIKRDFVRLAEEIAKAMVVAAEEQVTAANNMLEHTRAFADNLRDQIKAKDKELDEMSVKLRSFGQTVLDAHQKFNDELPINPAEGAAQHGDQNETS